MSEAVGTGVETGTSVYELVPWLPVSASSLQPVDGKVEWFIRYASQVNELPFGIPPWQPNAQCLTKTGGGVGPPKPTACGPLDEGNMHVGWVEHEWSGYAWPAAIEATGAPIGNKKWVNSHKPGDTYANSGPAIAFPGAVEKWPEMKSPGWWTIEGGWFSAKQTNQALANVIACAKKLAEMNPAKHPTAKALAVRMIEATANVPFDLPEDDTVEGVPIVWAFWWTTDVAQAHAHALRVAQHNKWKLPFYVPWEPNKTNWLGIAAVLSIVVGGAIVAGASACAAGAAGAAGAASSSAATTAATAAATTAAATTATTAASTGLLLGMTGTELLAAAGTVAGLGSSLLGDSDAGQALGTAAQVMNTLEASLPASTALDAGNDTNMNIDWAGLLGGVGSIGLGAVIENNPDLAGQLGSIGQALGLDVKAQGAPSTPATSPADLGGGGGPVYVPGPGGGVVELTPGPSWKTHALPAAAAVVGALAVVGIAKAR